MEKNISDEILKEFAQLIKHSNPNNFLMNVSEAAERLCVTKHTVYELIRNGKLSALKIKKYRISNYEINRFIDENYGKDLAEAIK